MWESLLKLEEYKPGIEGKPFVRKMHRNRSL